MDETRVLVSDTITCKCVRRHHPKITIIDKHHIVPLSWGGPDVPENMIPICSNQHRLVHELLTLYKKRSGYVLPSELRKFPRFTQALAKKGWENYKKGVVDAT